MSELQSGRLFCIPYEVQREGETPEQAGIRNGVILDHIQRHPLWIAGPTDETNVRETAAWLLTHPEYLKYEVWLGGRHVGMLLLSRITPNVDALLHFTFWGIDIINARQLLWNFCGHAFESYHLNRLSFEVPECVKGLGRFMREKLAFRYEGEYLCKEHPLIAHFQSPKAGQYRQPDAALWVAKQGSRREASYWDGKRWHDTLLLRLLKREYDQLGGSHSLVSAEPHATDDTPSSEPSNVARQQAREIRDLHPT